MLFNEIIILLFFKERETLESALREKQKQIDSYAAKAAAVFDGSSALTKQEQDHLHQKGDAKTNKKPVERNVRK